MLIVLRYTVSICVFVFVIFYLIVDVFWNTFYLSIIQFKINLLVSIVSRSAIRACSMLLALILILPIFIYISIHLLLIP